MLYTINYKYPDCKSWNCSRLVDEKELKTELELAAAGNNRVTRNSENTYTVTIYRYDR
jgi:hypothetical protein